MLTINATTRRRAYTPLAAVNWFGLYKWVVHHFVQVSDIPSLWFLQYMQCLRGPSSVQYACNGSYHNVYLICGHEGVSTVVETISKIYHSVTHDMCRYRLCWPNFPTDHLILSFHFAWLPQVVRTRFVLFALKALGGSYDIGFKNLFSYMQRLEGSERST